MKKVVLIFLLMFALALSACSPAVTAEMPPFYLAHINGKYVDVSPLLYYADYNRLFYSFLEKSLGDRFDDLVYDAAVSDFLTYYIILDEVDTRQLTLTDEELKLVDEDYEIYLNTRKNEYLSEDIVKKILSVYYYQEQIVASFDVDEETIRSSFLDGYNRFRYCIISKTDENGQKYSSEALDERKEIAYNIYASVYDGALTMSDAVIRFSDEYLDAEMYTGDERNEVEKENEILSETGFLVDSNGYMDYSDYPLPTDVQTALEGAGVGDIFFVENDAGYWICEKMNPLDLLENKREAVTEALRTELFSEWLDEKTAALTYDISRNMVEEYIYARP